MDFLNIEWLIQIKLKYIKNEPKDASRNLSGPVSMMVLKSSLEAEARSEKSNSSRRKYAPKTREMTLTPQTQNYHVKSLKISYGEKI